MTNQEMTIKNPVSDKLKKFVVDLVKTTKKEELNIAKQGIELRNMLVEYMQKDKTGLKKDGWKMSVLRNIIYDLASYDTTARDKFGVAIKNMTFENRVTRAVMDSVLKFNSYNPSNQTKNSKKGYQLNDKGEMCLPFSTLKPTRTETIKGVKQEIPNDDPQLVAISVDLRRNHFSEGFPEGTRVAKSTTGVTDWGVKANEITQYLIMLSDEQVNDFKEVKLFKELETALDKFFEKRTCLETTYEGNVINTTPAVMNG